MYGVSVFLALVVCSLKGALPPIQVVNGLMVLLALVGLGKESCFRARSPLLQVFKRSPGREPLRSPSSSVF